MKSLTAKPESKMHIYLITLVPSDVPLSDIPTYIESVMAPYDVAGGDEQPCGWCEGDDDECECEGTGVVSENPEGYWDWYRIGGRYDGVVKGINVLSDDNGFNCSKRHETLDYNTTPVADLLRALEEGRLFPYAILADKWYQCEYLDRGSYEFKKDPDWKNTVIKVLEARKDHIAVGMDCHV